MSEYLARKGQSEDPMGGEAFFDNYKDFLLSHLHQKENDTHQEIVGLDDLEEKSAKGFTRRKP